MAKKVYEKNKMREKEEKIHKVCTISSENG